MFILYLCYDNKIFYVLLIKYLIRSWPPPHPHKLNLPPVHPPQAVGASTARRRSPSETSSPEVFYCRRRPQSLFSPGSSRHSNRGRSTLCGTGRSGSALDALSSARAHWHPHRVPSPAASDKHDSSTRSCIRLCRIHSTPR